MEQLTMKLSGTQRDEGGYLYLEFKGQHTPEELVVLVKNQQSVSLETNKGYQVVVQFTGKIHNEYDLDFMLGLEGTVLLGDFPKGTLYVSRQYDEQFFMWQ